MFDAHANDGFLSMRLRQQLAGVSRWIIYKSSIRTVVNPLEDGLRCRIGRFVGQEEFRAKAAW